MLDAPNLARLAARLFARKPHPRSAEIVAALESERVTIKKEQWSMERVLWFEGHRKLVDGRDDIPLVVLRIAGREEQIDGGKRVTRWRHRGDKHSPLGLVVSPVL